MFEQLKHGRALMLGIVIAGERMQIGEGETTPGRAKDGEPRDAVHGVDERMDEREYIEKFLTIGQQFYFDCAKWDVVLA
jgi:hypothetical protein